jgi:hypothetical protein
MVLSWHLPGGTEESYKNPIGIAGVPDKIQTENPPNMSLEHYCYANQFNLVM